MGSLFFDSFFRATCWVDPRGRPLKTAINWGAIVGSALVVDR